MTDATGFQHIPTTTLGEILDRDRIMDFGIRPLWGPVGRVAGPAYTVRCTPGDNLMLHTAIYRAEPGSVIVVESGDLDWALAGGNVCAIAQRRGVAAFVLDGLIRDLAEVREARFPVFARGVIPIPGAKAAVAPLGEPVTCGGVRVEAGDVIVADEEGVAAVPFARRAEVLDLALAKLAKEADQTLDDWEAAHRARVEKILAEQGFEG
ncbi:RraA family protein [Streptomyces sp. NPDC092369]|uniref:RraA family protein n=1 Tax=Streptomyces sp. NPDC092369 TaxID=3366015 RepID=UPI00381F8086